jgi:peptidoglycan/xylan/chitin deacetylase (PgdA/CDA1 family)
MVITVLVVVAGFAMISPLFTSPNDATSKQLVMLSFSVSDTSGAVTWCHELSSFLRDHDLPASVFIVGKVAEHHPQVVTCFDDEVDIGSQTYSNTNLVNSPDYSEKLQEVRAGKRAVDKAGKLETSIFRAPYGATDQDIYSLLRRTGILADFSYVSQYNVYHENQFIKYEAKTYLASDHAPDFFATIPHTAVPVLIYVDSSYPISQVFSLVSILQQTDVTLVNATELTRLELTIRGDDGARP